MRLNAVAPFPQAQELVGQSSFVYRGLPKLGGRRVVWCGNTGKTCVAACVKAQHRMPAFFLTAGDPLELSPAKH